MLLVGTLASYVGAGIITVKLGMQIGKMVAHAGLLSEGSLMGKDNTKFMKTGTIDRKCAKCGGPLLRAGIAGGEVLWVCEKCKADYWGSPEGVVRTI